MLQCLQIIYGKADKVKQKIDAALHNDNIYRRRRAIHTLGMPTCFPLPQNMKNSSIPTWITWIRDESNELIAAIDEEIAMRQDPDDPFDGTASGIFTPLWHDEQDNQQHNPPGAQANEDIRELDELRKRNGQNNEAQEGRPADK